MIRATFLIALVAGEYGVDSDCAFDTSAGGCCSDNCDLDNFKTETKYCAQVYVGVTNVTTSAATANSYFNAVYTNLNNAAGPLLGVSANFLMANHQLSVAAPYSNAGPTNALQTGAPANQKRRGGDPLGHTTYKDYCSSCDCSTTCNTTPCLAPEVKPFDADVASNVLFEVQICGLTNAQYDTVVGAASAFVAVFQGSTLDASQTHDYPAFGFNKIRYDATSCSSESCGCSTSSSCGCGCGCSSSGSMIA
jgi:hypothetical protein